MTTKCIVLAFTLQEYSERLKKVAGVVRTEEPLNDCFLPRELEEIAEALDAHRAFIESRG